uniref:Uncharacterized protein n=1 Tax=Cannabis sativa TaxID=3483 RepID=A0A803PLM6_CANSA
MSNSPSSPLPQSSSGDEFHFDVRDRSPTCPETFSYRYRPIGEAIVGRMMRAYCASRNGASSSSGEEWLQNFFENKGRNVSSMSFMLFDCMLSVVATFIGCEQGIVMPGMRIWNVNA